MTTSRWSAPRAPPRPPLSVRRAPPADRAASTRDDRGSRLALDEPALEFADWRRTWLAQIRASGRAARASAIVDTTSIGVARRRDCSAAVDRRADRRSASTAAVLYFTLQVCGLHVRRDCAAAAGAAGRVSAAAQRRLPRRCSPRPAARRSARCSPASRVRPAGPDAGIGRSGCPFGTRSSGQRPIWHPLLPAGAGLSSGALPRRRPRAARRGRRHPRHQSVTRLAVFVATVGYCGYFPVAPGHGRIGRGPRRLPARLVDAIAGWSRSR